MPKSTDNEIVTSLLTDIRTSSESDKAYLRKEGKEFRTKFGIATEKILELSTEKARLERDVRFFRDTKLSREIGVVALAICSAFAPLFLQSWWSLIVYYCLITGAGVSVFWGVWFGRIKND